MMKLLLLVSLCCLSYAFGANYAVLVAGSNGFYNYRHQADACHAYQSLRKLGMPAANIITMMYDDIANDPSNPFPGKIFNKPTASGAAGVDVYVGCEIDYKGVDVTPAKFLAVLTGDAKTAGGRVLATTSNDHVFINFVDHGAPGLIAFPSDELLAADLLKALQTMHDKNMYGKLTFYLEACESGSMFEGILPTNISIYATTAANADESSYGTYCPPQDSVDGTELGTCLGDLYSVSWMENLDGKGAKETLAEQFQVVQNLTDQSHVMQYGTLDFINEIVGDFEGNEKSIAVEASAASPVSSTHIDSRDIKLHILYFNYLRVSRKQDARASAMAQSLLHAELDHRQKVDRLFALFPNMVLGNMDVDVFNSPSPANIMECGDCCKRSARVLRECGVMDDYGLKYYKAVVNTCHYALQKPDAVVAAAEKICKLY